MKKLNLLEICTVAGGEICKCINGPSKQLESDTSKEECKWACCLLNTATGMFAFGNHVYDCQGKVCDERGIWEEQFVVTN